MSSIKIPKHFFRHWFAHQMFPRESDNWGCIVAGFALKERPKLKTKSNHQTRYSMHVVFSGQIIHTDKLGETYTLFPGHFFQFIPGTKYRGYPNASDDFLEAVIIIDNETYDSCCELGMIDPDLSVGNAGELQEFLYLFEELILRLEHNYLPWHLSRVLDFIGRLYETNTAQSHKASDKVLEKALAILSDSPEKQLSMKEVAEQCGLPYEIFRKYFHSKMNVSPGHYRIRCRLKTACILLYQGYTIKDIAEKLGYNDQYFFSRQFKKIMGIPPKKFQEQDIWGI